MKRTLWWILSSALLIAAIPGQSCRVAADLNPGSYGRGSRIRPTWLGPLRPFLQAGGQFFFTANDEVHGDELWRTDGTAAGTYMVKDIYPGTPDSEVAQMEVLNSRLYFRARDGVHGIELWTSDGTAQGTFMVRDLSPGSVSSLPSGLVRLGSRIIFEATTRPTGRELFTTDGTAAGTRLLVDLAPGAAQLRNIGLRTLNRSGTRAYFYADHPSLGRELYSTDGTAAGTGLLKDLVPGSAGGAPYGFAPSPVPGEMLFTAEGPAGRELWKTDGTAGGTQLLKDIHPNGSSNPQIGLFARQLGGFYYFSAEDGTHGRELWRTDGTGPGTSFVADLRPGSAGSELFIMDQVGGVLLMSVDDGIHGRELWRTDGTNAGTTLVLDAIAGPGSSQIGEHAVVGASMLYRAAGSPPDGTELWISDGTSSGTRLLRDINPGADSGYPRYISPIGGGKAVFAATNGTATGFGEELYITDLTTAGTVLLKDLNPNRQGFSSNPVIMSVRGGESLYVAANTPGSRDLWRVNTSGASIPNGSPQPVSRSLSEWFWNGAEHLMLFEGRDSIHGRELWVGSDSGFRLLKDLVPGASSPVFGDFKVCGQQVFFVARISSRNELWCTNGTPAGTRRLLRPSNSVSTIQSVCFGDRLYFVAQDGFQGPELWVSDGTVAGTRQLLDLNPGSPGSNPAEMQRIGDRIVFSATTAASGRELFITDGTAAGTSLLRDLWPGTGSSNPSKLVVVGDEIFFVAVTPASGGELWRSDLTAAGTRQIADLNPGTGGVYIAELAVSGDRVFFAVSVPASPAGQELYMSDGTRLGTGLVADIRPGSSGSSPREFFAAGNGVYFTAEGETTGRELYFSDGTAAGTSLVCDLEPGLRSSSPEDLTLVGGNIYFVAETSQHGDELFVIDKDRGTVQPLGRGCGGDGPRIRALNAPVLGTQFEIAGDRAPTSGPRILAIGLPASPTLIPGLTVPGCPVWLDLSVTLVQPLAGGRAWTQQFAVTNSPALSGLTLTIQAAFEPGLQLSSALQVTLGR